LWIDGALSGLRELAHLGGPGTGGALLLLPLAIAMLPVSAAGLAVAALLFTRAARTVALIAGAGGCLLSLASLPLVLVTFIYLGVIVDSGHWPAAVATGAAPILFALTLIDGLLPPVARRWSWRGAGATVGAAVALMIIGPLHLFGEKTLSEAEQTTLRPRFEKAIDDEDEAVLRDRQILKVSFDVPHGDGSSESGDAVMRAIARDKPRATAALLRQHHKFADLYLRQALARGNRAVLDEVIHVDRDPEPEVWDEALRSARLESIDFALAHGQTPDGLCARMNEVLGLDAGDEARKRRYLVAKGARQCEAK